MSVPSHLNVTFFTQPHYKFVFKRTFNTVQIRRRFIHTYNQ